MAAPKDRFGSTLKKNCQRGAAAGLPPTAEMVTDGHHRWSVPIPDLILQFT
jgi:hypothetical protein